MTVIVIVVASDSASFAVAVTIVLVVFVMAVVASVIFVMLLRPDFGRFLDSLLERRSGNVKPSIRL